MNLIKKSNFFSPDDLLQAIFLYQTQLSKAYV